MLKVCCEECGKEEVQETNTVPEGWIVVVGEDVWHFDTWKCLEGFAAKEDEGEGV